MKARNISMFGKAQALRALTLVVALATIHAGTATAQQPQVIHGISGLPGYNFSAGGLVSDAAGNLYGTTELGGTGNCKLGCGTVFELTPGASGWSFNIIYSFTDGPDGSSPTTGVAFDAKGNLYGATYNTIYRLSPATGGGWTETTLYTFTGKADGWYPAGPLVTDAAGNVYGAAEYGGSLVGACSPSGCGVVFKLSPNSDGSWTETVLYTFTGGSDGANPLGGVTLVGQNLYGATSLGGTLADCGGTGCGVIFKLSPASAGWKEFVLHSFSGGWDGGRPFGTLVADSSGNLFGTAEYVAFELTNSSGKWQEKVLHRFVKDSVGYPASAVMLDATGNIYGESDSSYCSTFISNCGVVYELSNSVSGWGVSASYRLGQTNPSGYLLLDSAGDIFGIVNGPSETGSSGVFEITP
jgi:hypothetical protein